MRAKSTVSPVPATLIGLVPPPQAPNDAGNSDAWPRIEQALGLALPRDYKGYIDTYGRGVVADFIHPFDPFTPDEAADRDELAAHYKHVREVQGRDLFPYAIYPERGGLLPWGETENGDALFWLTEGDPDSWPTIVTGTRNVHVERYNLPMTTFLTRFVEGSIESRVLATLPLDETTPFQPLPTTA